MSGFPSPTLPWDTEAVRHLVKLMVFPGQAESRFRCALLPQCKLSELQKGEGFPVLLAKSQNCPSPPCRFVTDPEGTVLKVQGVGDVRFGARGVRSEQGKFQVNAKGEGG